MTSGHVYCTIMENISWSGDHVFSWRTIALTKWKWSAVVDASQPDSHSLFSDLCDPQCLRKRQRLGTGTLFLAYTVHQLQTCSVNQVFRSQTLFTQLIIVFGEPDHWSSDYISIFTLSLYRHSKQILINQYSSAVTFTVKGFIMYIVTQSQNLFIELMFLCIV